MNVAALASTSLGPGTSWVFGGLCWLVLRLITRLDIAEAKQAKTDRKVDAICRKLGIEIVEDIAPPY